MKDFFPLCISRQHLCLTTLSSNCCIFCVSSSNMSSVEESMSALSLSTFSYKYDGPILRGQHRQYFAFSDKIMYYIAMNPASAEVYKKLVRTCKYFYNLNPILVVRTLYLRENEFASCELLTDGFFDLEKVPFKIWVTESLNINERFQELQYPHYISATFVEKKKLFRSDAAEITFGMQVLTLDELLLLSSMAKKIKFLCCQITENDGSLGEGEVMFEKIIEKLPKLRDITWTCKYFGKNLKYFSGNTVKELIKIPHFGDVTSFRISCMTNQLFDVKALFEYAKKCKNMHVNLHYVDIDFSAKLKKDIDDIIDEVLGTEVFTYKPPKIHYDGLDTEKKKKMNEIFERYENTQF